MSLICGCRCCCCCCCAVRFINPKSSARNENESRSKTQRQKKKKTIYGSQVRIASYSSSLLSLHVESFGLTACVCNDSIKSNKVKISHITNQIVEKKKKSLLPLLSVCVCVCVCRFSSQLSVNKKRGRNTYLLIGNSPENRT